MKNPPASTSRNPISHPCVVSPRTARHPSTRSREKGAEPAMRHAKSVRRRRAR